MGIKLCLLCAMAINLLWLLSKVLALEFEKEIKHRELRAQYRAAHLERRITASKHSTPIILFWQMRGVRQLIIHSIVLCQQQCKSYLLFFAPFGLQNIDLKLSSGPGHSMRFLAEWEFRSAAVCDSVRPFRSYHLLWWCPHNIPVIYKSTEKGELKNMIAHGQFTAILFVHRADFRRLDFYLDFFYLCHNFLWTSSILWECKHSISTPDSHHISQINRFTIIQSSPPRFCELCTWTCKRAYMLWLDS